jgi:hypothetical protein
MLATVHGCVALHEPSPQLIRESSAYRYGEVGEEQLAAILKKSRKPPQEGVLYCESNQTLSLIIPVLCRAFPQARFIWLLRNGLDTVASAYSKQWYSGHSERHDRYEDCTPLEKEWIDGRIQGDRCGDVSAESWQQMDRFAKVCWYWDYLNRLIEHDLQRYAPGRFLLVRLETLGQQLPDILQWLGLRAALLPKPKRINPGKRPPYPWQTWTPDHCQTFIRWCGARMDALYPQWRDAQGNWRAISYQPPTYHTPNWLNYYRLIREINRWLAPNRIR